MMFDPSNDEYSGTGSLFIHNINILAAPSEQYPNIDL